MHNGLRLTLTPAGHHENDLRPGRYIRENTATGRMSFINVGRDGTGRHSQQSTRAGGRGRYGDRLDPPDEDYPRTRARARAPADARDDDHPTQAELFALYERPPHQDANIVYRAPADVGDDDLDDRPPPYTERGE
jgi:hypothetical protein